MKDALSAVRQFTSEGNLSRNGNLNTTTMKEMWDYESQEPFSGKTRDVSKKAPEKSKSSQVKPKNECELCGGNHEAEQCPHERKFSLGMDTTGSDTKDKLPDGKGKSRLFQATMEIACNMEASSISQWNNKPCEISSY